MAAVSVPLDRVALGCVSCDDGNVCTDDTCDATDTCVHTNNTAPCNDGNACTTNDTCQGGVCVGGAPPNCDDGNPCTDDICDAQMGCLHAANSAPCTDGNACTTGDVCNGGVCVGGSPGPGCNSCSAVADIPALGGTFVGQTSGSGTLSGSCVGGSSSPERVYRWIPATGGQATISTCGAGTNFDTVVYVRNSNCASGVEEACSNDVTGCTIADGTARGSKAQPIVVADTPYYIVVDGAVGASGTYSLTVVPPSVCGNNVREGLEQCDGTDHAGCPSGQCDTDCLCVPPAGGLPDLVPQVKDIAVQFGATVASGDVAEGCAEQQSNVDLMQFTTMSLNIGTADFYLGPSLCPAPCTAHPLEVCANPEFICSPAAGHNHAHYTNYARYELLDGTGQALVVGHKQGFCLLDGGCPNQKYTCTNQGLTAGCSDQYASNLGCQYLDITGVPSGSYSLRITIDPFHRISELSEANNIVTVPVTIPPRPTTTTTTSTTSITTTIAPSTTTTSSSTSSTSTVSTTTTSSSTSTVSTTTTTSSVSTTSSTVSTTSSTSTLSTSSTLVPTTSTSVTVATTSTSSTSLTSTSSTASSTTSTSTSSSSTSTSASTSSSSSTSSTAVVSTTSSTSTSTSSTAVVSTTSSTSTSTSSTVVVPTTSSTSTSTTLPTGACAAPTVVPPQGGVFTGTTSGASTLTSGCVNTGIAPERVFQWTPAVSGAARIETCSATQTTFDTVLYMRQGSCASGAQVACNDDTQGCGITIDTANPFHASRITPTVTAGQTYFIVVDGYSTSQGNFALTIVPPGSVSTTTVPTPTTTTTSTLGTTTTSSTSTSTTSSTVTTTTSSTLPNNACLAPTVIGTEGGTVVSATSGTSTLVGTCGGNIAPERTFQWVAPRSGVATIQTCSSTQTTFDTVLYLRQGSCASGTQVACNDDTQGCGITIDTANPFHGSRITPTVTAGQTYFIVVDGYATSQGTFALSVTPPP